LRLGPLVHHSIVFDDFSMKIQAIQAPARSMRMFLAGSPPRR
jgi:hypothetical protein